MPAEVDVGPLRPRGRGVREELGAVRDGPLLPRSLGGLVVEGALGGLAPEQGGHRSRGERIGVGDLLAVNTQGVLTGCHLGFGQVQRPVRKDLENLDTGTAVLRVCHDPQTCRGGPGRSSAAGDAQVRSVELADHASDQMLEVVPPEGAVAQLAIALVLRRPVDTVQVGGIEALVEHRPGLAQRFLLHQPVVGVDLGLPGDVGRVPPGDRSLLELAAIEEEESLAVLLQSQGSEVEAPVDQSPLVLAVRVHRPDLAPLEVEESLAVGCDDDAVGFLNVARGDLHGAVWFDQEHGLEVELARLVANVARVGEVDVAAMCDSQVVRAVEALSLEAIGQCANLTLGVGDRDAAVAARRRSFAGHEFALGIKLQSVRFAARIAKDGGRLRGRVEDGPLVPQGGSAMTSCDLDTSVPIGSSTIPTHWPCFRNWASTTPAVGSRWRMRVESGDWMPKWSWRSCFAA